MLTASRGPWLPCRRGRAGSTAWRGEMCIRDRLRGVVLGEGDVDILLLAGLHADQLVLETGDKATGADLKIKVLALAAIERLAVVKALKIDIRGVALLHGAVHGDQTAVADVYKRQHLA